MDYNKRKCDKKKKLQGSGAAWLNMTSKGQKYGTCPTMKRIWDGQQYNNKQNMLECTLDHTWTGHCS